MGVINILIALMLSRIIANPKKYETLNVQIINNLAIGILIIATPLKIIIKLIISASNIRKDNMRIINILKIGIAKTGLITRVMDISQGRSLEIILIETCMTQRAHRKPVSFMITVSRAAIALTNMDKMIEIVYSASSSLILSSVK